MRGGRVERERIRERESDHPWPMEQKTTAGLFLFHLTSDWNLVFHFRWAVHSSSQDLLCILSDFYVLRNYNSVPRLEITFICHQLCPKMVFCVFVDDHLDGHPPISRSLFFLFFSSLLFLFRSLPFPLLTTLRNRIGVIATAAQNRHPGSVVFRTEIHSFEKERNGKGE